MLRGSSAAFVVGSILAVLVVGSIGVVSVRALAEQAETARWVIHTETVIGALERLSAGVRESESASRGWAVGGDERHLESERQARVRALATLEELERLVSDNPQQTVRIKAIRPLVREKLGFVSGVLEVGRNEGLEAARHRIAGGEGAEIMREFDERIGEMFDAERSLLAGRRTATDRSAAWAARVLAAGSMAGIAIVLASMMVMLVQTRARARATAAVAASEARLRDLFEAAPDGMLLIDAAGTIRRVNGAAERMFGWAATELSGRPVEVLIPDEHRTIHGSHRRSFFTAPQTRTMGSGLDLFAERKDGTRFAVDVSLGAIAGEDGTAVLAAVRDVTARKAAEAAARKAEERFRAVVATSPHAITVHAAADGRYLDVNPAFERIHGMSRERALGRTPVEVGAWPDADEYRAFARMLATSGTVTGFETTLRGRDGEPLPVLLSAAAIEFGEPAIVAFASDISAQKQAAAEMNRARELAIEASRLKSEFLASMSHEIRTPMNGVLGMTNLLLDGDLAADQRHYAETIRSCGESLLEILNDILDFSKIESGKLAIEPLPTDLDLAVEQVAEMLAPRAHEKGLEIVARIDPKAPRRAVADAGRIRQILTNLLGNAIKFTAAGHVVVSLACDGVADGVATLRFSVLDTGIGIPPDRLGAIFQRFTQADTSTTRLYGGTGLGLAISKQLVELMGGTIGVESTPGRGSTFWFTLPLPLTDVTIPSPAPAADLRGARVLIVDDQPINREILREQLTHWGFVPAEAESGEEALAVLRDASATREPFRLAIVDQNMPGMGGEALARTIKTEPALAATGLVLLTSVGGPGVAKLAEAGFTTCIVKPARQSEILNALAVAWGAHAERTTSAPEQRGGAAIPARVLLVEDNVVNQRIAIAMLRKLGATVDVAADGREAVRMVESFPYDLVFMDCQMPVMDGYAATAEIRRRERPGTRLPIVAMTAHAMAGDREKCIAAGMDDYVAKPVSRPVILGMLEHHVARRRDTPTAPPPPAFPGDVLDAAQIEDLRDLCPKDFPEVVERFIARTAESLGRLERAVGDAAAGEASLIAHDAAGSCATMGLIGAVAPLRAIERAARDGRLEGVGAAILEARRAFEKGREALSAAAGMPPTEVAAAQRSGRGV